MTTVEFDDVSADYDRQHRESIRLSGEEPDYFADYKVRDLARLASARNLVAPSILDFGSGIGNSLPAFRKYFDASDLATADPSAESLKLAQETHGVRETQFVITDQAIPAPDDAFDIVFAACVFHHIPPQEVVHWLSELRRVTKPGGLAYIFEHNPLNPLTRRAVANCPFDENATLINASQLRRYLSEAGWIRPRTEFHIFFPAALRAMRFAEPALRRCALGAQYAAFATAP